MGLAGGGVWEEKAAASDLHSRWLWDTEAAKIDLSVLTLGSFSVLSTLLSNRLSPVSTV